MMNCFNLSNMLVFGVIHLVILILLIGIAVFVFNSIFGTSEYE